MTAVAAASVLVRVAQPWGQARNDNYKGDVNCTWSGCGRGGGVDTLRSALSSTSCLPLVWCEDDFYSFPSLSSCNLLADSHGATIPEIRWRLMISNVSVYPNFWLNAWFSRHNKYKYTSDLVFNRYCSFLPLIPHLQRVSFLAVFLVGQMHSSTTKGHLLARRFQL